MTPPFHQDHRIPPIQNGGFHAGPFAGDGVQSIFGGQVEGGDAGEYAREEEAEVLEQEADFVGEILEEGGRRR